MARDIFVNSVLRRDAEGDAQPLRDVRVEVVVAGTSNLATIYQNRTGAAQGPANGSLATGNNPFTTGDTGQIMFWAESGEYDVRISDTVVPPRIAAYTVGFQALNPSDVLSAMGAIIRVGMQIPWVGTGDPAGGRFMVCDGRTLTASAYPELDALIGPNATNPSSRHRYNNGVSPGSGLIKLPDKRGVSPVGAIDMGTSSPLNAVNDNARVNIAHGARFGERNHPLLVGELAQHSHTITDPGHSHGITDPGHNHSLSSWGTEGGGATSPKYLTNLQASSWFPFISSSLTGISVNSSITGVTAANTGSGTGHNTVHPVEADTWIIRVI